MDITKFTSHDEGMRHDASKYNVALDWEPEYSAIVGSIISTFAMIEEYVPQLLQMLTTLDAQDARSIMGCFRSFAGRLDLLKSVYNPKGENSPDAIIGRYYVSLFKNANKIRNKYAHAQYSSTNKSIILKPFNSDFNRKTTLIEQTKDDFKKDLMTLRTITCELHALIHRSEIPVELHAQLKKLNQ